VSWYPDMGCNTMVAEGDHVRAVGWLSSSKYFPRGEVPADFLARLREFYRLSGHSYKALQFRIFAGKHTCDFCEKVDCSRDFGVATETELFVAPGMIVHYIESHGYLPPSEFISAVLVAPLPDTEVYANLAVPFRKAHEAARDRDRQLQMEHAVRTALQLGGTEEAIREAASRCYGNGADEICALIRKAMPQG
jgi:hypothetical protein